MHLLHSQHPDSEHIYEVLQNMPSGLLAQHSTLC